MTISIARRAPALDTFFGTDLQAADADLFAAVAQETERQQTQIELIASENIVSRAVLEAQGSVLTNKYAEAIPDGGITAAVSMSISPKR